MTLPNPEALFVERGEIVDCLLSPTRRYGASKARFFGAFGFCAEDWEQFAQALREHGQRHPVARRLLPWLLLLTALAASHALPGEGSKYESDWAAFASEIDRGYPFFELKGIRGDWDKFKEQAAPRAKACGSDDGFLSLVRGAIYCLRDAHMGFIKVNANSSPITPEYYPGISFLPATQDRVVIMAAESSTLKPGTVVVEIDGGPARAVLEQRAKGAWNAGGPFSSPQRARLFEYRIPFCGKKSERHTLTLQTAAGRQSVTLTSDTVARGWPHTFNLPAKLAKGSATCHYTKLAGGAGYIYLRNLDENTPAGIAAALTAHADAKGWIVDLRGNGGGGYSEGLLEKLRAIPKPVAVLIDAGCISAGETLARDLVRLSDARLFGETTAGASSAKRSWTFPSGLATLSLAARSRVGADGQPIEFNGVTPHEAVEVVPEEMQRGQNSAILRAEEYLAKPR